MDIGIDLGYCDTKVVAAGREPARFPSVAGSPEQASFSLNGHTQDIILTLPEHVLVGEGAVIQSRFLDRREDRNWVTSDTYYHLFLAGLTEMTRATAADLTVVTGLPVAFYGDRELVRERFLANGTHRVQRHGRHAQTFRVTDCRVIPQPFGALLAEALDDSGRIADTDLATGEVGVIDVGGKTTNLLSVRRMSEVARETASVSLGAWDVARAVGDYLADACPGLDRRDHDLQNAIRDRTTSYYGERVDLSPVVDQALARMADQVIAEAGHLWNGGARLAAVLVAGGGAHLLGDRIKAHFRHARVVTNPVFANAIGYWKFARRLSQANR